jgi:ribosomal-protein-alanine N-acetyltransferase
MIEIEKACYCDPWTEEMLANELKFRAYNLPLGGYAAPQSGRKELVGMCLSHLVAEEIRVLDLAVHPDFQSKGYGRSLMHAALNRAIAAGVRKARLEVRASNRTAQTLYCSLGFLATGHRRNYYVRQREDAILMTLDPVPSKYPRDYIEEGTI